MIQKENGFQNHFNVTIIIRDLKCLKKKEEAAGKHIYNPMKDIPCFTIKQETKNRDGNEYMMERSTSKIDAKLVLWASTYFRTFIEHFICSCSQFSVL